MKRHGSADADMNRSIEVSSRVMKTADETTSSLKLVGGPIRDMILSWAIEKSSMLF